jgi:hypothetical protein
MPQEKKEKSGVYGSVITALISVIVSGGAMLYWKDAAVDRCHAEYERQLSSKEGELREKDKTIASLETALGFKSHEIQLLLSSFEREETPVEISYLGSVLKGTVELQGRHLHREGCFEVPLSFKNTGATSLKILVVKAMTPAPYGAVLPRSFDYALQREGPLRVAHLQDLSMNRNIVLPPGATEQIPWGMCKSRELDNGGILFMALNAGEKIDVTLYVFGEGYKEKKVSFQFLVKEEFKQPL